MGIRRAWPLGLALALLFPWLPGVGSSTVGAANRGAAYALVAVALVVLTGWVGQISLGHAAFVGVGAYTTGWMAGGIGLPFPLNLPPAVLAGAGAAALLGVVALRVRGLFLAVATLIFSWMASEFLFRQEWFTRHDLVPDRPIGGEGTFPSFAFTDRRTFYYVAWAVAAGAVYLATNLRDSKTGRAFFAVRGSEMATASLGIDVTRYKLLAFAVSGGLAGAAGNVVMSSAGAVTADQFTFTASLFFLAVAVVGGLRSLGGAVASSLLFAALDEAFFRVPALAGYLELVSTGLLAVTLLVYPTGIAGVAAAVALRLPSLQLRATVLSTRLGRRTRPSRLEPEPLLQWAQAEKTERPADAPARPAVRHLELVPHTATPNVSRADRRVLVEADSVTVRFGGLVAVGDASLQVREGEITGLIGPNGAGKTTLFNSIAGFVTPTEGTIRLFGNDVTDQPVHVRARLGVVRTFQAIQLFGQLTVFENLLVATHLQNQSGVFSHLVVTADALQYETAARQRVAEVIELLDLQSVADRTTADLPFGVLRMVELARALVTGFRVMMLDEPASGLDNAETDRLVEMLKFVRDLGVSVLLIEHDVRMVAAVSDYLYVLDQGRIIAQGPAEEIQRDPVVVAAYLGEPASPVAV